MIKTKSAKESVISGKEVSGSVTSSFNNSLSKQVNNSASIEINSSQNELNSNSVENSSQFLKSAT